MNEIDIDIIGIEMFEAANYQLLQTIVHDVYLSKDTTISFYPSSSNIYECYNWFEIIMNLLKQDKSKKSDDLLRVCYAVMRKLKQITFVF